MCHQTERRKVMAGYYSSSFFGSLSEKFTAGNSCTNSIDIPNKWSVFFITVCGSNPNSSIGFMFEAIT